MCVRDDVTQVVQRVVEVVHATTLTRVDAQSSHLGSSPLLGALKTSVLVGGSSGRGQVCLASLHADVVF